MSYIPLPLIDFGFSYPRFNDQTGTTYTVQPSDNGKVLTFTNASAITVTLPDDLPVGFNCLTVQMGAGTVTFSAAGGGSLLNVNGHTDLSGQYAYGSLLVTSNAGSAAQWLLGGATA